MANFRKAKSSLIAMLALGLSISPAFGQLFSERPIRIIVPLAPGSSIDIVARTISEPLAKSFGRRVIIENMPSAGGITGTLHIVQAQKDGNTLGIVSSQHTISPFIFASIPFDSIKDITPISVLGTLPVVLVTHPSVQAKTTKELIALLKRSPGKFNYGSSGNGSALHLAAVLFSLDAGVDVKHIPYKGTGPLITDIIGGQIEMSFLGLTAAAQPVKAGRLRAIAVSTTTRASMLPEVPTLAESGLPNYSFGSWIAAIGPAGLPRAQVNDLYSKFKNALAQKEVLDALAVQGVSVLASAPEDAEPFFRSELEKHGRLVKGSGAKVE